MTAQLALERFKAGAAPRPHVAPQEHHERIARSALSTLWARKWLIAAVAVCGVVLASVALAFTEPRYTAEATILPDFGEPDVTAKAPQAAVQDGGDLVDSAARIVRSRATASAVVTRLRLDQDPAYARLPLAVRALSLLQSSLGVSPVGSTESRHDLAVNALIREVTVTNEPRSYLISISVTARDPERAATIANAVAGEYLRAKRVQQLTGAQAAAVRELALLSSTYGSRHPLYLDGHARLEDLDSRLRALRSEDSAELPKEEGRFLLPAERVDVPSAPNVLLILELAAGGAVAAGVWLALALPGRRRPAGDRNLKKVGRP